MGDLSKNFSKREFACKCGCGLNDPTHALVSVLQAIRDHAGTPVSIISGWRCTKRNADAGSRILGKTLERGQVGDETASAHTRGEAADITVNGKTKYQLYELIRELYAAGRLPELQYCYIIKDSAASVHVGVDKKERKSVFGGEQ